MTGRAFKRTFDVVGSILLIVPALPMIVLIAFGTAVSLRTSPFFAQTRIGRNGESFKFIKLRTLPRHAPRYTDKYDLGHLEIPAFCRLVRRLHLDELPQLLLVLVGKMSLVGPRPEMAYLHEHFDPAFAARRAMVRPGCTGLWQVSDRNERLIYEHPEFDTFYVENRSMWFDLWILARTLGHLLPFRPPERVAYGDLSRWSATTRPSAVTPSSAVESVLSGTEA